MADGHAPGIVAAILELLEPAHYQICRVLITSDIAEDSAHGAPPARRCGADGEGAGSRRRAIPTRRHSEWSLSARHRAGLLHPSRPCPPRDHPPNRSIGPCLVIRPVGRTWRSSHVTPVPLNSWPRGLLPETGLGLKGRIPL